MKKLTIYILLLISCLSYLYANTTDQALVILNHDFFSNFLKTDPIKRDFLLDTLLNKNLQGRGYVKSVTIYNRYNKKFRIVITDKEAINLNIRYHIFTNEGEYIKLLKKSDVFEFKGQLIIYTPLSLRKDAYIFDIILSDGALVVK